MEVLYKKLYGFKNTVIERVASLWRAEERQGETGSVAWPDSYGACEQRPEGGKLSEQPVSASDYWDEWRESADNGDKRRKEQWLSED